MNRLLHPYSAYLLAALTLMLTLRLPSAFSAQESLSRAKAKTLIDASSDFQQMRTVKLSDEGIKKGKDEGLWTTLVFDMQLSARAQQIFKEISAEFMQGYKATLQTPVKAKVLEITGIADAMGLMGVTSSTKQAEFTWDYENLPTIVKGYATQGGTGKALFRLYDDGWRIQRIELDYSKKPIQLTAAETDQAKGMQQTLERDAARMSHIPTKMLAQYNMREYLANNNVGIIGTLNVTDVGIEWTSAKGRHFVAPFSCGLPKFIDMEVRIYRFSNDNPSEAGPAALSLTAIMPGVQKNGLIVGSPSYNYGQLREVEITIRSAIVKWKEKYGNATECIIPSSLAIPGTMP